jgi:hypothetical protein
MKQVDLRDMFKNAPKSVCNQLLWYLLTPFLLLHQLLQPQRLQKNTEEDPDDPEEADIQMEYPSD